MPTNDELKLKEKMLESSVQAARERQAKMKQEATARGQLEKDGIKEEQTQLADKAWKELIQQSDELIKKGQMGFDNWMSAACSLVAIAHKLVEAIRASDPLGELVGTVGSLYNLIPKGDEPLPELSELPRLQYYADIKDGKLEFDSLSDIKRSDGDPLFPKPTGKNEAELAENTAELDEVRGNLEEQFKIGIVLWLNQNGYKAKPGEPGVFVDVHDDSIRLTKTEFDRLRAHPDRGLDAFLHNKFDLDFEPAPAPAGPRP